MHSEELRRYSRQILIEEIGEEGQIKLNSGNVLLIGCGALGSLCAMQLAGAGIGNITVADFDTIDVSNLHRQLFYRANDCGKSKVKILSERMRDLNPGIEINSVHSYIKKESALELFPRYDIIVDATDSACVKRMISRICKETDKVCSIGGISGFRGQVTTLYPEDIRLDEYFEDEEDGLMPCEISGVISPAAGICASVQTSEVIKFLLGKGEMLRNKVLFFDLLKNLFFVADK